MKAMKAADIRKMSPEEMRAKISDKRDELMKLRFRQVSGQLTDAASLNVLRKDIARMETILAEALRNAAVEGAK
jgi:large subunit ribosomal protein L29